jgi:hypothetical protein
VSGHVPDTSRAKWCQLCTEVPVLKSGSFGFCDLRLKRLMVYVIGRMKGTKWWEYATKHPVLQCGALEFYDLRQSGR